MITNGTTNGTTDRTTDRTITESMTNDFIYNELRLLGVDSPETYDVFKIRDKDGIYLYRIANGNQSYVHKTFLNDAYKREIRNYQMLIELGVPTLQVIEMTDQSILMEDVEVSKSHRLGVKEDLSNPQVAKALASWYKTLHQAGENYVKRCGGDLYSELEVITEERIREIMILSKTEENEVWAELIEALPRIMEQVNQCGQTITYNDFYWTNFSVKKDESEALMFDYNLLGKGFRYNDIRNVCASLSIEAAEVFLAEYGAYDEIEKWIDDCLSILVNLIFAYERPEFPDWGMDSLEAISDGRLKESLRLLNSMSNVSTAAIVAAIEADLKSSLPSQSFPSRT